MESVDIFYGPLVCLTAIWYILWPFGIFWVRLVHFFLFWYAVQRKIWQHYRLSTLFFIGTAFGTFV
jgi:hypothetical protein